ncbi:MAG: hypothetical protein Q4B67_04815 [Eubacteriales bacterium]|nr:hypothetical protein [Eubacteriales bacterium]
MKGILRFLLAVLINMILRFEYVLPLIIAMVLHLVIGISGKWPLVVLLVWVIHSIVITILMTAAVNCRSIPKQQKGVSLHPGRTEKFRQMYEGVTKQSFDGAEKSASDITVNADTSSDNDTTSDN